MVIDTKIPFVHILTYSWAFFGYTQCVYVCILYWIRGTFYRRNRPTGRQKRFCCNICLRSNTVKSDIHTSMRFAASTSSTLSKSASNTLNRIRVPTEKICQRNRSMTAFWTIYWKKKKIECGHVIHGGK